LPIANCQLLLFPASLLIFPHIFTFVKCGKDAPHRMDIGFSIIHAPVFVTCLWTNFQTIDFRQDTKRKKPFDLNYEESKFTLVL
jgi:hypothetical protein